ncbi:MAG: aminotransferase class I/II-fold pyridoxal phosphate-dependent enzyme [bacterium]
MNPFRQNLADFHIGHDEDPLKAPDDFLAWRRSEPEIHALFERTLTEAADVHTSIQTPAADQRVINMASLDYLGICRNPAVVQAQQAALDVWGSGACGVPLLSGMTTKHRELEDQMSALTGKSGTILFSSGFAGAIGICSAILRRGDVAILDAFAHMSWVDGVHMSGAGLATFDHNDPESLDAMLTKFGSKRRIVVVDGLYSMDGDYANLPALLDVCDRHGVGLIVDEAHSIFAVGKNGGGATEHFGVSDRVRMVFGTFSKALSVIGAFASADAELLEYVRYYSHPYVFSAALPPATVAGISAAVDVIRNDSEIRPRLAANADYFRQSLQARGFDTGTSESHVVPVIVGSDRELLYRGTHALMMRGLFVAPVDYPAVPEDKVRLRCAVSAGHSREDLDFAVDLITDVFAAARHT